MSTNTQSHAHQKRIRKLTRLIKELHPLLARIPAPLPPIDSEANRISQKLSAKEATARKEVFGKQDERRLDKETVRYWVTAPDDSYGRKV